MREAASLVLAARLIAEGAQVRAYDPVVGPNAIEPVRGVSVCPSPEATIEDADGAVLVTEWPALVNLDWPELRPLMRQPVIVDGRNALSPQLMAEAGYVYEGIGRVVAGPADASEERGPAATVGDPQT
jgi:UDPglucose 6-dehydrogenase